MGYNKEKSEKLISALNTAAELVGEKKVVDGHMIGLDLTADNKKCLFASKNARDGLFSVAVMGTFSCGKSTTINALIGSRILPESMTPTTAILTYIRYGSDENNAEVHFKSRIADDGKSVIPGDIKEMSIEDFKKEYRYTKQDEQEFNKTRSVQRFSIVDYAIINCMCPLMEGGVQIVDSPGLEDKAIATELALKIAKESQAIIYVLPEKGPDVDDKKYIIDNFKNCPNNVFFLLNRFDYIKSNADRESVIENTKLYLRPVFTRDDGTIDEDLLNRRLFAVSALFALDSRRGFRYSGEEQKDLPIDERKRNDLLNRSGFLPFEKELETFLRTDEKCIAQYMSSFQLLSRVYRSALDRVTHDLQIFESKHHVSEVEKSECTENINQIHDKIKILEGTFDNASLKIQNASSNLVSQCANEIDRTWNNDLDKICSELDFGMIDYLKLGIKNLNFLKTEEERKAKVMEALTPLVDAVAMYLQKEIDNYFTENNAVVQKAVKESENAIGQEMKGIQSLIGDLNKTLTPNGKQISTPTATPNVLQGILSLVAGDYSQIVKNAAGGSASWMDFIKKTVFNTLWQLLLLSSIDGGMSTLAIIVIELLQIRTSRSATVKKLLTQVKDASVISIKENMGRAIKGLNNKIAIKIGEIKEKECSDLKLQLSDEETHLNKIFEALNKNDFDAAEERTRTSYILLTLSNTIREAYHFVLGQDLSEQQLQVL